MEDNDVQLQIKKRARRRLIGAIFFVSVVAVVLPMVMDEAPKQALQDVEIRIPGQDEKPFAPQLAAVPAPKTAPKPELAPAPAVAAEEKPVVPAAAPVKPTARVLETAREKIDEKPAAKAAEKPEKPAPKTVDKTPAVEKPVAKDDEAKRAAAILTGQSKSAEKTGEYLVLIGAFSDDANVSILKKKLGELKIKVITEALNTPQGKKTRVRAGPFANKDAADQALAKMRRIGVSGVVAAKQ